MTQPKFSFSLGTSTPAPAAAQPAAFGGFGAATSTPAPATSTGFGGFGAASAVKPSTSTFGFGSIGTTAAATTAATTSPFGQKTAATANTSIFGSTQPAQAQPQASIFSFNKPATQPAAAQPQQQTTLLNNTSQLNQTAQPQAPQISQEEILVNALINATVYNDERDLILAKWNQLQAYYGTGKVFYQNQAIEINKENRMNRFKSISYNCKPMYKNENGMVNLILNQKEETVRTNQKNVTDVLHKIFNNDQSLAVKIDSIKAIEEGTKSEVIFYVEQRVNQMTDEKNIVPSQTVFQHLSKADAPAVSTGMFNTLKTATNTTKQQLESIGVVNMYPLVGLSDEQVKKYLDTPPVGLNPSLWDLAKKNNPNPQKLLPVPITGFDEINKRFKLQKQENESQKSTIFGINQKIESLNSRNKLIKSKIEQMKQHNENLEQRILKVIINYEIRRKMGIPLQETERYLFNILESFQIELSSPINKEIQRQKLSEFTQVIKTMEQKQQVKGKRQLEQQAANRLSDATQLSEVHKSLREQQKAFKSLIDIINNDLKDLNVIKQSI